MVVSARPCTYNEAAFASNRDARPNTKKPGRDFVGTGAKPARPPSFRKGECRPLERVNIDQNYVESDLCEILENFFI